ncbi:acetyltransferase [Cellulomonas sp. URHB0016]
MTAERQGAGGPLSEEVGSEHEDVAILREDDERVAPLLAAGWTVESESWGARLHLTDDDHLARLAARVEQVRAQGWRVVRLGPDQAEAIVALDALCAVDYPWTPATAHDVPGVAELESSLALGGWWAFGAFGPLGDLDAVTVLYPADARVDTEFTVTRRAVRGRGLATAVKAAAVVELAAQGHRVFGTGGAAVNTASLRANTALGYVLEPRWLSLRRP